MIKSSDAFIYYILKADLYTKYVVIDCDVVLNDETFDKEGNPSGGDGKIYSWQKPYRIGYSYIDAKDHYVYGLYANLTAESSELDYFALLSGGGAKLMEIKNIKIDNAYVNIKNAKRVALLAGLVEKIENCHTYNAYVEGEDCVAGLADYVYTDVKNCTNRAKVVTRVSHAGGICRNLLTKMENCNNYGEVVSINTDTGNGRVAGLVCQTDRKNPIIIKNCNNYGNISAPRGTVAGIISFVMIDITVENCKNYGELTSSQAAGVGSVIACIVYSSNVTINNFYNYGKLYAKDVAIGEFIGNEYRDAEKTRAMISITNSYSLSYSGNPLLGYLIYDLYVNNVKLDRMSSRQENFILFKYCNEAVDEINIEVKNLIVNESFKPKYTYIYVRNDAKVINMKMKNVIINSDVTNFRMPSTSAGVLNFEVDGFLITGKEKKEYIGSNFSGFYYSWKLGSFGLVALDGRGSFQGTIDEEWLLNNGFKKKIV